MTTKQNAPRGTGRRNDYWERIKSTMDDTTEHVWYRVGKPYPALVLYNRCVFCDGDIDNFGLAYHESCGRSFREFVDTAARKRERSDKQITTFVALSEEASREFERRESERVKHWFELQPWRDKAEKLGVLKDFSP